MRIKAYIKCEPNKGYIPSDKLTYHGQSFEQSSNALDIADVRAMWKATGKVTPYMRQTINDAINQWLRDNFGDQTKTGKLFYLNFNADGVDVYQWRSIWD